MSFWRKIAVWIGVILLASCHELPDYFAGDKTLAQVGERKLRLSHLETAVPQGMQGEDSIAFVRVYIDRWVRKQVKLQEAEQLFSESANDIDRMVEEYRQSLLIRKLDQRIVDRNIDTTFTDKEITAYYNTHKSDFKLDRPLVKGRIVRFKSGYNQSVKLRTLMAASSESQQQDFNDLCAKNEFPLTDFEDRWVDFSEFLSYLPALRSQNYESMLSSSKVEEMRYKQWHYYSQITAVRRVGDPIPQELVTMTIRRILFKQRQSELLKQYEEALYQKALEDKTCEWFTERPQPETPSKDQRQTVKKEKQQPADTLSKTPTVPIIDTLPPTGNPSASSQTEDAETEKKQN